MADTKQQVRAFWEREACGERYGSGHDRARYEMEPEIIPFADFVSGHGRRVLEIGIGMGSDFIRWARCGADIVGIDLTERAVAITRGRLEGRDLPGVVEVGDAEQLPFPDGHFDIVYSWGVLHHTPRPEVAFGEAVRVLAPGGELRVMVYHRRSWVALAAWARFCLLRGRPQRTLSEAVAHIESPGTRAFTVEEVEAIFRPHLDELEVRPVVTHWDRKVAPVVARRLGDRFGWFLLIKGTKRSH